MARIGSIRSILPEVSRSHFGPLLLFGMGPLSKRRSFPRKRESSPSTPHFQRFAEWIPALAGMTAACGPTGRGRLPARRLLNGGDVAQEPHFAEAAKLLVVIQAITNHENVGNLETNVVGLDGNGAAGGLIE